MFSVKGFKKRWRDLWIEFVESFGLLGRAETLELWRVGYSNEFAGLECFLVCCVEACVYKTPVEPVDRLRELRKIRPLHPKVGVCA